MRIPLVRLALSLTVSAGLAYAQAGPTFEVSPAVAGARSMVWRTPESLAFQSALVKKLIAFAYDLPMDRIERQPQWMYDNPYDVALTTATPATLPEQKVMLQKLLKERFGLVVHRVSNPSQVYYLVRGYEVSLTPTKEPDAADIPEFRRRIPVLQPGDPRPRGEVYVAEHASMSDLTAWLYSLVRLPVLDKTGIQGLFDLEISGLPMRASAEGAIPAVKNSLGLVLEVHPGTAESLIIDRVEKPNQN